MILHKNLSVFDVWITKSGRAIFKVWEMVGVVSVLGREWIEVESDLVIDAISLLSFGRRRVLAG